MRDEERIARYAARYNIPPLSAAGLSAPPTSQALPGSSAGDRKAAQAALLHTRHQINGKKEPSKGLLGRFRSDSRIEKKNATFTIQERRDAFNRLLEAREAVGVAQAVLEFHPNERLDVNVRNEVHTKHNAPVVITSRWLEQATETSQRDYVRLLASRNPKPNQNSMDKALKIAIAKNFLEIAEDLIGYGANVNTCHDSFRAFVSSRNRTWTTIFLQAKAFTLDQVERNQALQVAVSNDDFELAHLLLSYGADAIHGSGASLTTAVREQYFRLLTLLIAKSPILTRDSLNDAIRCAVASLSSNVPRGIETVELLVAAGAYVPSQLLPKVLALVLSTSNIDILSLFVKHKQIPAETATRTMQQIMASSSDDEAFQVASLLFAAGANAKPLGNVLCWAIEKYCDRIVDLLVSRGVSLDWNDGKAVRFVLLRHDIKMLSRILGTSNTRSATSIADGRILASTLPHALAVASREQRKQAINLLVLKGVDGPDLDQSLLDVVSTPAIRDTEVIETLLTGGASVNYYKGDANCVLRAAEDVNVTILRRLTTSDTTVKPSILTQALVHVYAARTMSLHRDVIAAMELLLDRGTQCNNATALPTFLTAIQASDDPDCAAIAQTLLQHGADINWKDGEVIESAFTRAQGQIFGAICNTGRISEATFSVTLPTILSGSRADQTRLRIFLQSCNTFKKVISDALITELREYAVGGQDEIVNILLQNEASVNHNKGAVFSIAVALSPPERSLSRLQLFLRHSPDHQALKTAFDSTRKLTCQPAHRYKLFECILTKGYRGRSVQKALSENLNANIEDVAFSRLLLRYGAFQGPDTDTILIKAITSGLIELADLVLAQDPSTSSINKAFTALCNAELSNVVQIALFKKTLATKKVSQSSITYALSHAINNGDKDPVTLALLASNGAVIEDDTLLNLVVGRDLDTVRLLFRYTDPGKRARSSALKACLNIERDTRYDFAQQMMIGEIESDIWLAASKQATIDHDFNLLQLLLDKQQGYPDQVSQALAFAVQSIDPIAVRILVDAKPGPIAFEHAFEIMLDSSGNHSNDNLVTIASVLLEHGVSQRSKDQALIRSLQAFPGPLYAIHEVLVRNNADVNTDSCSSFQIAGRIDDLKAFHFLLDSGANFDGVIQCLAQQFPQDAYERLLELCYITFKSPHFHSEQSGVGVLFDAMRRFPRGDQLVQLLLNNGYSAGDTLLVKDGVTLDTSFVTPTIWALSQPGQIISDKVILSLLAEGARARPDFVTEASGTNAVSLATQFRRLAILERLISLNVDTAIEDSDGKTPLFYATANSDQVAVHLLLEDRVPSNDGSLHEAARLREPDIVVMLLGQDHDPDFSSNIHDGRTPLGELCSQAMLQDGQDLAAANKTLRLLIDAGSDLSFKTKGKTILHLAFENDRPIEITRALLRFPEIYKDIRSDSEMFLFEDVEGRYMSPDVYIQQHVDSTEQTKQELLRLLAGVSCKSKWFRKKGAQPAGYKGLPPDLLKVMERADLEDQAEARAIQRRLESARIDQEIRQRQHELTTVHTEQEASQRLRLEDDLSSQRRRNAAADHAQERTALLERTRIENDAATERGQIEYRATKARGELEYQNASNMKQLEYSSQQAQDQQRYAARQQEAALEYTSMQIIKALTNSSQREQDQQRYIAQEREAGLERRMLESREAADKRSHDRMMQRLSKQKSTIALQAAEQRKLIAAQEAANVNVQRAIAWSDVDPD